MKCPRCEDASLDERERDGIVVDACARCRGIWLDRGELEKLIAVATREIDALAAPRGGDHRGEPWRDDRREHGYDRHDRPKRYPRRRSWLESLGEIFD